jgi:hypothetical protein
MDDVEAGKAKKKYRIPNLLPVVATMTPSSAKLFGRRVDLYSFCLCSYRFSSSLQEYTLFQILLAVLAFHRYITNVKIMESISVGCAWPMLLSDKFLDHVSDKNTEMTLSMWRPSYSTSKQTHWQLSVKVVKAEINRRIGGRSNTINTARTSKGAELKQIIMMDYLKRSSLLNCRVF